MRTVHICIDLQHGESHYFQENEWPDLVTNAVHLKRRLAGIDIPTIHVGFIESTGSTYIEPIIGSMAEVSATLRPHHINLTDESRLAFAIPVKDDELVGTKPDFSVTSSAPIMKYLRDNNVEEIILSGVFESYTKDIEKSCLSISAATFARRGFNVTIAADATNVQTCRPLSLAERQAIHAPYGVMVTPVDEMMQQLVERYHAERTMAAGMIPTID